MSDGNKGWLPTTHNSQEWMARFHYPRGRKIFDRVGIETGSEPAETAACLRKECPVLYGGCLAKSLAVNEGARLGPMIDP